MWGMVGGRVCLDEGIMKECESETKIRVKDIISRNDCIDR